MPDQWIRIKELFAACVEMPPAERASFLAYACPDQTLIPREVLSLVASYEQSADFLEQPAAVGAIDPLDAATAGGGVQLEPGRRLGPYEVLERAGAGGMGEVYRARDVRLDRIVALKVLPSAGRGEEARRRFELEARTISSLNHPHICALYDVGCHEGVDFLVMEFLEGETLARRLERGALPPADIHRYAIQIADALDRAHRQGVIHRDLKPSNIMLTEQGAKLLDFGIAKLQSAGAEAAIDVSQASGETSLRTTIVGTAAYMSPEQIRGEPIDVRSDLFSLGAVIYEMSAGRRPFAGGTTEEVRRAIATTTASTLTSVEPQADGRLSAVIAKALEPDRTRRYQRAADMRRDLQQLTHASRRTPWFAAALAATAVVALAPVFLGPLKRTPAIPATTTRSVAVLPFKPLGNAGADDYIGPALADALITELAALRTVTVRPLSASSRYHGPHDNPVAAGRTLNADVVVDGWIERLGDRLNVEVKVVRVADGRILWSDTFHSRWNDVFRIQDTIAEQVARALAITLGDEGRERIRRRRTGSLESYEAYLKGRYFWNTRTADGLHKALGYFQTAIRHDPMYGPAHAGLADTYALLGSLLVAALPPREAGPKALAAARRALELDETLAEAHVSFAFATYSFNWDWASADRHFRRAIELDPEYGTARHWYALYLGQLGRLDEALVEAQRGLRIEPLSLVGTYSVGLVHYQARRFDLAREYARKLLEVAPEFPHGTRLMGAVDVAQGRYGPPIVSHERLRALHPRNSLYSAWLAHAYGRAGQRARAQRILDELQAAAKTRYVSAANIAIGYIGLGDTDAALSWLERGYEERSQALTFLKIDPVYDSLRTDPRFADLMRRVGFVP